MNLSSRLPLLIVISLLATPCAAERAWFQRCLVGIEIGPTVKVTRVDDNLSPYEPENRAEVNFTIRVPLARGRGAKDTAAEETAAR